MHHGRGLQKCRQEVRADLDLIVNEFKQIGLIGFLIMNATILC